MRKVIWSLIIAVGLLCLSIAWLGYTTTGLKTLLIVAPKLTNTSLTVGEVSGSLLKTMQLQDINYQKGKQQLHINTFSLSWQPLALLNNTLQISHLKTSGITLLNQDNQADDPKHKKMKKPSQTIRQRLSSIKLNLPLSLDLNNIIIENLDIKTSEGTALQIRSLNAFGVANPSQVDMQLNIETKGPQPLHINALFQGNLATLHSKIQITGQWQKHPIKGNVDATFKQQHLSQLSVQLSNPSNHIQASAIKQERWNINWKIHAPKLQEILPNMLGSLQTTGNISHPHQHMHINMQFMAHGLKLDKLHLFKLDGNIQSTAAETLSYTIEGKRLRTSIYALDHFRFTGSADLNKQEIEGLYQLQQSQLNLNVKGNYGAQLRKHLLNYQLNAKANTGSINLIGRTQLNQDHWPTHIDITGDQFKISDTPELSLSVTPHLTMETDHHKIILKGSITIPHANIQPRDFSATVTMPNEVVYVENKQSGNQTTPTPSDNLQLISDIDLILGKDIHLKYMGLTGRIAGQVKLFDQPGKPTLAQGQLTLNEGKYKAFGTEMTINYGHLTYENDLLTNPSLNLNASRKLQATSTSSVLGMAQLEDITVGIDVIGKLQKPKITLFSKPSMSNENILSYLVLGQPISALSANNAHSGSTLSDEQKKLLVRAVAALNVGGDNGIAAITGKIRNQLGLSDLGLETQQISEGDHYVQNTAFALGKYLSPKLYVNFSIGLLQHRESIKIRYSINKNWSIQTEGTSDGKGSGIDIFYTIERN